MFLQLYVILIFYVFFRDGGFNAFQASASTKQACNYRAEPKTTACGQKQGNANRTKQARGGGGGVEIFVGIKTGWRPFLWG